MTQTLSAVLRATGLAKHYGDKTVLSRVDLSLQASEIIVLLGENGAGKTTLMRLLAGELPADAGEVRVMDVDLRLHAERARAHLVYVAQHPPLAPLCSLREHAEAMSGFRGLAPSWPAELQALAATFRLERSLDLPIRSLSGGMAHKAALCLAFLSRAPLILLDEPHTGLDVRSALALRDLIRARRDQGTAFVLASHMAEATLAVATRAAVVAGGVLARVFEPTDLAQFGGDARQFEQAVLQAMG